jgi:uncharacterized protein YqjF (DUF2071 family)
MDRPLFIADWKSALMIHFRVAPQVLSKLVPFELDIRDGNAFVSLVAFTQDRLRPTRGGRLAEKLSAPLARHEFLNLRAYIRVDRQPAIYFLAEWIPNRLAVLIGPRTYGLPYRLARLRYRHDEQTGELKGKVLAGQSAIEYRGHIASREYKVAQHGSFDEFFLERYIACTHRDDVGRRFNVAHAPWPQARADVELLQMSLMDSIFAQGELEPIGANYSPGIRDIQISRPQFLLTEARAYA